MPPRPPGSTIPHSTHSIGNRLPESAVVTGVDLPPDDGERVGVYGASRTNAGVWAHSEQNIGLYARGGELAGQFDGNVQFNGNVEIAGVITRVGNIRCTGDMEFPNADCAEDFDVACSETIDGGTVVAVDADGVLHASCAAYDSRVVGVISGAGRYRPALILDRHGGGRRRMPVALMGKVYCKVDAGYAPVAAGDLLTSSPTPGHAMKAVDPARAFGSVIGKALRPLGEGQQLIPILVTRQ